MKNSLLIVLLLIIICACNRAPENAERKPDPLFRTTQPSHLYFKNMRSYYYSQSMQAHTNIDLYILKKNPQTPDHPIIIPVIADNWMRDEAYILLETTGFTNINPDSLLIKWEGYQNEAGGVISWKPDKMHEQYNAAKAIYKHLKSGDKISYFSSDKRWKLLFSSPEDIENFLKTMEDYYRLIESEWKNT